MALGYDSLYLKDVFYYSALNDAIEQTSISVSTIKVFPNPSNSYFTISYSLPNAKGYYCSLYDLNRKLLMHEPIDETKNFQDFKTDLFPNGIFF